MAKLESYQLLTLNDLNFLISTIYINGSKRLADPILYFLHFTFPNNFFWMGVINKIATNNKTEQKHLEQTKLIRHTALYAREIKQIISNIKLLGDDTHTPTLIPFRKK